MELSDLTGFADFQNWRATAMSILVSYILTQSIGYVYAKTYRGLSYSRSMVHALVVGGICSAMLMLAIGNSLARGIGIVGTLALIRFRTNLRDPMDMVFIFAAFGAGIAAGTGSFAAGIIGTYFFLFVITGLRYTNFGSLKQFEGVIRIRLPGGPESAEELKEILRENCVRFVLITLREASQGESYEHAYQVTLRDPDDEIGFVEELNAIPGAAGVAISMQEATVEL